jgi:hypothetical protein
METLLILAALFVCLGNAGRIYRERMRQQKFEALRQRIIGNRYCGKIDIEVGGRYFEK